MSYLAEVTTINCDGTGRLKIPWDFLTTILVWKNVPCTYPSRSMCSFFEPLSRDIYVFLPQLSLYSTYTSSSTLITLYSIFHKPDFHSNLLVSMYTFNSQKLSFFIGWDEWRIIFFFFYIGITKHTILNW